jgi:hypothetical protein
MQLSCALGQIEIFVNGRLIFKNLAGLSIHLEVTAGRGLDDGRRLRGLLLC